MNSNSDSKSGGVYDCRAGDFSGVELQCDRLGVGRRDSGTQHSRAQQSTARMQTVPGKKREGWASGGPGELVLGSAPS